MNYKKRIDAIESRVPREPEPVTLDIYIHCSKGCTHEEHPVETETEKPNENLTINFHYESDNRSFTNERIKQWQM